MLIVKGPGDDEVGICAIQGVKDATFRVRVHEHTGKASAFLSTDGLRRLRDGITAILDDAAEAQPRRWRYGSINILGNAHDAIRVINEKHRDWDVVAMSFDGENGTPGSVTLVVYRTREAPTVEDPRSRTDGATDGG